MTALDPVTIADLLPTVGTVFRVDLGEPGTLELTLLRVDGYGSAPAADDPGARRQPFSLEFRGPFDPQLAQATYGLMHGALGPLAVFLVPIARDPEGMRYQAIFG